MVKGILVGVADIGIYCTSTCKVLASAPSRFAKGLLLIYGW